MSVRACCACFTGPSLMFVRALLWSLAAMVFGKGGGGLLPPDVKGGGVGVKVGAVGLRGFLPLVAFCPSSCPSGRVIGLQFSQWCNSSLSVPSALVPTFIRMQDCPTLSIILKGPSNFGPKGVVLPFFRYI